MKWFVSILKHEVNFIFLKLSEHESDINFTFLVCNLEPQVKSFELISVIAWN